MLPCVSGWLLAILLAAVWLVSPLTGSQLSAQPDEKKQPEKKEDPFAALIGKKAPDLIGDFALNGKPVKLSELRGKVVLIDFWAVWCGPCIRVFPHLNGWHKEYRDQGLEVIGVTAYQRYYQFDKAAGRVKFVGEKVEDTETGKVILKGEITHDEEHAMLKEFASHHKLKYRIMTLSKENYTKAHEDFHFRGIPTAVLIDRLGTVRMIRAGASEANAEALEAEIRKLIAEK